MMIDLGRTAKCEVCGRPVPVAWANDDGKHRGHALCIMVKRDGVSGVDGKKKHTDP